MKSCILPHIRAILFFAGHTAKRRILPLVLGFLVNTTHLAGQQVNAEPDTEKQTIQVLLQRIDQLEAKVTRLDQLEARVAELERARSGTVASPSAPVPALAGVPSGAGTREQGETTEPEKMDVNRTLLNIRGFGDFSLHGDSHKGDTTSFSLGELDLFITSNISDRFKFLSELVFEVHRNNYFEEDLERILLEYAYNDYFKLAAGRYHTAIGYYNTSHHHTNWFETATERPFLFQFEDQGGILPTHSVGVSASGLIPSGKLGLHYTAEVGNGRTSRSPRLQPVQNLVDENNHKDVNLAIFARPDAVSGLQAGFSTYRDVLFPVGKPRIGETIFDTYAVLVRSDFEWLNEAVLIRHAPQGSHVYDTPGFYTQISERFGSYRPYLRYQYVNASNTEPVFPQVGLRAGPSAGLRYDANEMVSLKLQYDYTSLRRQSGFSGLAFKVGFAF